MTIQAVTDLQETANHTAQLFSIWSLTGQPLRTLLALLIVLALTSTAPLAHANEHAEQVAINIVKARDLGCSNDPSSFFSSEADLRVSVYLADALVLQTDKAQDQKEPYYGSWTTLDSVPVPSTFRVVIEEAEPGGFFGLGTRWVQCDAAPGTDREFNLTWAGGTQVFTARGDESDAAEATIVIGPSIPLAPVVSVEPGTQSAEVAWTGGPSDGYKIAWGGAGAVIASVTGEVSDYTLTPLLDNSQYQIRVMRESGPWLIASPVVRFTTDNLPPEPAVITGLAEAPENRTRVEWHSPTTHDIDRYEVHAGPVGFTPGEGTSRGLQSSSPFTWLDVVFSESDEVVRILSIDTGGLTALSEPVDVNERFAQSSGASDRNPPSGHHTSLGEAPFDLGGNNALENDIPLWALGAMAVLGLALLGMVGILGFLIGRR